MKSPARITALVALVSVSAVTVFASIEKFGAKRDRAPEGWTKFEWPEKRAVLFGQYAPTAEEAALIDKALPEKATAQPASPRRILQFYRCAYPHASIATGKLAFEKLAEKTGAYAIDASDDPAVFTAENLAKYDAVLLNNSVGFETFLSDEQRAALLAFVKGGKGLIGIHGAADSCKGWPEGAEMIGGVFQSHPWTSGGTWGIQLESPEHPLNAAFDKKGLFLRDEIYHYRAGSFSRDRSRVLNGLDMAQGRNFDGEGMHEKLRKLVKADGDYPIGWLHEYGEGRVFYSNLGHNNTTYWHPTVLKHWLDGIQYALGDIKADATPSAKLAETKVAKAPAKKIVFLGGNKSHRSGDHEFRAGCILLAKALNRQTELDIDAEVISGWPADESVLEGADSIVIYCDSDSVHREHYPRLKELSDKGAGLFFMHYGVHPKDPVDGIKYYLPTIGGFMETDFSVNPHWAADMSAPAGHPVGRGLDGPVKAFDEFYYSLIYREDSIPLAIATPTKDNMIEGSNLWNRRAIAAYGKPVRLMWGFERPDGTRGGGFTGGHYHRNWALDDFRKLVLNAIVWSAGVEVPQGGVKSAKISEKEINANLDAKEPMVHIALPLKSAMDYRDEIMGARAARNKQREEAKRKKAERQKAKAKAEASHKKKAQPWRPLLDRELSQWEAWIGVPHKSVEIPGRPRSESDNGTTGGEPLGMRDPLDVFSTIEEDGKPVLAISGHRKSGR